MLKKILFLFLLFTTLVNAQHTITGKMNPPEKFSWIVLYQLKGAKQDYIVNTTVTNGEFTMTIPKTATPGTYRLIYDIQNRLFVDVIYNNEDISLTFNPLHPNQSIKFSTSNENKIYQQYLKAILKPQQQLDSLQVVYFNATDSKIDKKISELYQKQYANLQATQQQFETLSKEKLVNHFIKASKRYNAATPQKVPSEYLTEVKNHFFDAIDFNDNVLLNSTFISDKINDFIFYMNSSDDKATLTKLRKEAITEVLSKIKGNPKLSKDIQEGLLYNFAQQQDITLTNHVLNSYIQLPKELQDVAFIGDIKGQLRTAVGNMAPNILWTKDSKPKSLHKLYGSPYYLVVFWSSTCSHCLKQMPLLRDYLKNRNDVEVIAIGLETEESKAGWKDETYYYPKWTHIYGKGKWKNTFARDYGVNATPSFYLLDTQKKIVAKPDDVEELKQFFKEIK